MRSLLVYPEPQPAAISEVLDGAGFLWKAVSSAEHAERLEPSDGWGGAVVFAGQDAAAAVSFCRSMRSQNVPLKPVVLVISAEHLHSIQIDDELCDDFCTAESVPAELEVRLRSQIRRAGVDDRPEICEYGSLVLNLETYQAAIAGRPLDLTYMEYELLKFLAKQPGKVFTREVLLSRVWGYEYYGGARTVDVHVRRLRAKLGDEHANLISTVRSVGYRFGQGRL